VRVGILTGGGDCPGLNAVLRAVVRKGERFHGDEIIGFKDAWDGVREGRTMPLTVDTMRGSLPRGGTVLGTKRGSPYDHPQGVAEVHRTFRELGIDALIVVGGNGSLTIAHSLAEEEGLPIVGVPKTIDNDVVGTDMTFGFHTAVQIATEAIDRLHTTAESHDRVMVVEVMGRHSGWIAAYAGIAGGASVVLIPEIPFDIEKVCLHLARRHDKGRYASIVVVAEGAEPIPGTVEMGEKVYDKFGHVRLGGIADVIAREVGDRTGFETRVVMLGHVQRGGTPTAFDRVLSTRYGVAAIDLVHDQGWGQMVALRGTEIVPVPLADTVGQTKPLDMNLYHGVAEVFFS
jgi:6-phosphofructokinase 1